jgi:hypothetical protein
VKKEVVKLARKHDVVFCAYAILHAIAKAQDLVPYGINTLLAKFNQFLTEREDVGIALFDRPPGQYKNPYQHLTNTFQAGLKLEGRRSVALQNVIGYGITWDGASHLASMADILLGSFRYCVNEQGKDIASAAIFPTLARVMWHRKGRDGTRELREYGLTLRPAKITFEGYQQDYDDLVKRLRGYLKATGAP